MVGQVNITLGRRLVFLLWRSCLRGFVKLKKIKKIREKLGNGWVGQAPTRIIIFLGKFCVGPTNECRML